METNKRTGHITVSGGNTGKKPKLISKEEAERIKNKALREKEEAEKKKGK